MRHFFLLTTILLTSTVYASERIDLSKVSLTEIQKYESQFLQELKEKNTSPEEIQKKYLLAAKKFSEEAEDQKAYYLLKKGYAVATPSIEYANMYLNYTLSIGEKNHFVPIFEKTIKKISPESKLTEDEIDLAAENIVTYMRLTNTLSSNVDLGLQDILKKSSLVDSIGWNDSITYSKKKDFKNALMLLEKLPVIGDEDNLYKSFLQAKLGQIPKFCLSITTVRERLQDFYYKKTCALITNTDSKANLEEKIKSTGELLEDTPLHEAINSK